MQQHAIITNKLRCRLCSKWRNPNEFVFDPVVGYCFSCLDWHQKAMDALMCGDPPSECHGCLTPTDLLPRDANGDLRLHLVQRDGIYAFLCNPCTEEYERKRIDLYGDTPYGLAKGLKTKT